MPSFAALRRHRLAPFAGLLLAGAVMAGALPPFYFFPLMPFGFALYYYFLADCRSTRHAALAGFAFHWGYFIAGLYWISAALLVDAAQFAWMIPLSLVALPAVLALYGAAHAALLHKLSRRYSYYTVLHGLLFAVSYGVMEWLRGHLLTGFPWNLPGYAFGFSTTLLQTASLIGGYGLTILAVLFSISFAFLFKKRGSLAVSSAILLIAMTAFGWLRLQQPVETVPGIYLRLVQANIPQSLKWDREQVYANFYKYIHLSQIKAPRPVTHVIWPETAVPFPVDRNRAPRMEMARAVPKDGLLIFGAPRIDGEDRLYNSLIAMDGRGEIIGHYDKSHLVPFGEYVPLSKILPLKKLTAGLTDYSAGPGPETVTLPGLPPFSPLICYETIFPGAVEKPDLSARFLLNVTNDAWYGQTTGPYQHLAASQMRAVEQGLPMVRSANTGISAVIDPFGRIAAFLPLGATGTLETELPQPLPERSVYAGLNKMIADTLGL